MITDTTIKSSITTHLIEITAILVLLGASVYGVESLIAKHDASNDAKWQAVLTQQKAQSDADSARLETVLQQITAQNAALSQAIIQRNAALAKVKQVDASLTSKQVAQKLGGTATDDSNISLPIDTARNVAFEIDELATISANLTDETKIAQGLQTEVTQQAIVITDLNKQLATQDTSCKAQVADVKAKARKNYFKVFFAGVIVGIIGGHAAGL